MILIFISLYLKYTSGFLQYIFFTFVFLSTLNIIYFGLHFRCFHFYCSLSLMDLWVLSIINIRNISVVVTYLSLFSFSYFHYMYLKSSVKEGYARVHGYCVLSFLILFVFVLDYIETVFLGTGLKNRIFGAYF